MRCFVCSKESVLQGVFTQKKHLWKELEDHCDVNELVIKLTKDKITPLNYNKLCKYLTRRGMLVIYLKEDMEAFDGMIDECPPTYKIWAAVTNEHYELKGTNGKV